MKPKNQLLAQRPESQRALSPERLAYKLGEFSQMCGISKVTARRLIARGAIRPMRNLRHVLISRREIERFISES